MEKKQNTPALKSCQLKLDAEAVAGVHIDYKMVTQIKDESTRSWTYHTPQGIIFKEYLMADNMEPLIYVKNLYLESPDAVILGLSRQDTMPDIINHEKYRQVYLELMDDIDLIDFTREIVLIQIQVEKLDDSKPFSRDYKRYRDFDQFLKVNNWIRSLNDPITSKLDWTVRDTAMYFIDGLKRYGLDHLIPKLLSSLDNISKQAKLNHKIRL